VVNRYRLLGNKLRGNLTHAILKVEFWHVTYLNAAISRIGQRTFVNIVIIYLYMKNDLHKHHLMPRKFRTLFRPASFGEGLYFFITHCVLIFLGVR